MAAVHTDSTSPIGAPLALRKERAGCSPPPLTTPMSEGSTTATMPVPLDGDDGEDAAGNERMASLASSLTPPLEEGAVAIKWDMAVAAGVAALSRIVAPYIDVTAMRVAPTYGAVVSKLRELRNHAAVPKFHAAWEELRRTPDGRAVIAVCRVAAAGGIPLGRRYLTRTADDAALQSRVESLYEGASCVPACVAAIRYYRAHTAAPTREPELPSLASLTPRLLSSEHSLPLTWYWATAPALMTLERIVARYLPAGTVAAEGILPMSDAIVMVMQSLNHDGAVPLFEAECAGLAGSEDGRADLVTVALRHWLPTLTWKPR